MDESHMPLVLPVVVIAGLFMVLGAATAFYRLLVGDFRRSEQAKLDLPDEHPAATPQEHQP